MNVEYQLKLFVDDFLAGRLSGESFEENFGDLFDSDSIELEPSYYLRIIRAVLERYSPL